MNRAGAVFSVVIFVAGSVFAQVHIRENATITPGPVNTVQGVVTPVITVIPSTIAPGDTANIDVR